MYKSFNIFNFYYISLILKLQFLIMTQISFCAYKVFILLLNLESFAQDQTRYASNETRERERERVVRSDGPSVGARVIMSQ